MGIVSWSLAKAATSLSLFAVVGFFWRVLCAGARRLFLRFTKNHFLSRSRLGSSLNHSKVLTK